MKESIVKGVAALNVYKKVAIIRRSTDVLSYEDTDGNVKTISDLHRAGAATTPVNKVKPKNDIPVPTIKTVETYNKDITPTYECPTSYVRHRRPTYQELKDDIEYVIDAEDEIWLMNNTKFGGGGGSTTASASASSTDEKSKKRELDNISTTTTAATTTTTTSNDSISAVTNERGVFRLPLSMFEIMIDMLEKATAFDIIVTLDQAEILILKRFPQLYQMYPLKGRSGIVTIKIVITDVYNYWVSKRSKLKRPLLRRFWPVTSSDDTNPHLVFRPREKEKYKLRKKRQNDMDAYRKLSQLKQDFYHLKVLCVLTKQREELNRLYVLLQREWFRQKIYEATDTSGTARCTSSSSLLHRTQIERLLKVKKYFEIRESNNNRKNKNPSSSSLSRRGSQSGKMSSSSRSNSPMPDGQQEVGGLFVGGGSGAGAGGSSSIGTNNLLTAGTGSIGGVEHGGSQSFLSSDPPVVPLIVAGQNNGEPAPSFLHPLSTRETYTADWDDAVPHVTTFVDAVPQPTFRFRHRPRVGRGGRICIDRMPLPVGDVDEYIPPMTFFRAGNNQSQPNRPKKRLLELLPRPLDREALSQRIHDMCLEQVKEEYDKHALLSSEGRMTAAVGGGGGGGGGAAAVGVGGSGILSQNVLAAENGDDNDGEAIVVDLDEWLNTDDQRWGEERYSIGPL